MGVINEKDEYLEEIMVYESNKNLCSLLVYWNILKYTENKMPKQEEVKSVLSFISYRQSSMLLYSKVETKLYKQDEK